MNEEVKALWVGALRGGAYPQTKQRLKDDVGYCCLGVLCEVYMKEYPQAPLRWVKRKDEGCYAFHDERDNLMERALLPKIVANWAGLSSISPEIPANEALTSLNDNGFSFGDIADLIDSKL